ncbi:MAG: bifunctional folylpolyglutamate synthase/dihydrofolate synthase [Lachnospiraceae bacterium]|nr:bifunctional folylpolyglutamate synthase/dihydrofolate synthase [Lachnospiraceae bacterium]
MKRFETAEKAIEYLNDCHWAVWKLGLSRTKDLLHLLGDPQKKLKFVHIAGTNGKGSTCAMTESVLRHAGYKTGMFPSPFIERFNERIQVNCEEIPDDDLARITGIVADAADSMDDHPRHFELVTAIGMLWFAEQKCDIVVLEVGMGGEFDSTNVIDPPEAAVICNIGLDHTQFLGNTVEEIAKTKGGIIKPGSAVVLYDNVPSVCSVIEKITEEKGDRLYYARDVDLKPVSSSLKGQVFMAEGEEYTLSLLGRHQLQNAKVVLKIIESLRDKEWKIPLSAVREGLSSAKWPARFELLAEDPVFILDGGHNPQCAEAMADAVSEYLPDTKVTFLIGMLGDKDYSRTLDIISPYAAEFVTLTPESERALPASELAETIIKKGFKAEAFDDTDEGISCARSKGRPVIAFGSLYMAGSIRKRFH